MYSNVFNVFMANFQPEMVARVAHRVASTARVSQWNIKLLMVHNHPIYYIYCLLLSMTFPCAINAISIWVLRSWNPNFMVKTSISWFNPIFFSWRNHKACLLNQIINSLCSVTILTDWFTVFGKKKTSFFTIRSSCLLRHRNTEAVACSSCIRSTRTNLQVVKEIHRNYGMQWSKWDFNGI